MDGTVRRWCSATRTYRQSTWRQRLNASRLLAEGAVGTEDGKQDGQGRRAGDDEEATDGVGGCGQR